MLLGWQAIDVLSQRKVCFGIRAGKNFVWGSDVVELCHLPSQVDPE
jgi:hypothetical protein